MKYKNPANDYTEEISGPLSWLWCLLFGPLYWVVKGVWRHAIAQFILNCATFFLAQLIYPIFHLLYFGKTL